MLDDQNYHFCTLYSFLYLGKTEGGETVLSELLEEEGDAHPIPSTFDVSYVNYG